MIFPMNSQESPQNRREFIKTTAGGVAAASALAGVAIPHVHAQGSDTVQIALVGCGGRGTGAASNALSTKQGPTKLIAMADVFGDKLTGSHNALSNRYEKTMDVPNDRKFIGFDAYKQAIDCLKAGDVAIFATPPAFRWVHYKYAVEKGVNVFMEKPVTVDGPSSRRMLEINKGAVAKNLKVGVGLMCRHCDARKELHSRIKGGEIGDILLLRAYRMHGPVGSAFTGPQEEAGGDFKDMSELMYQIRRFHSFIWASGGLYSDFYIHNIDESCWMKDAWPVKASALGGRHYRGDKVDQNFDSYAVEYTFEDGTKFQFSGRTMNGCRDEFASYAHGTKGLGVISTASHSPARCRTFKGQVMSRPNMLWAAKQPEADPYQLEWEHLMQAIRKNEAYNEVDRGVQASLVTSMGRMAAHTGQEISYEQILNSDHELAPMLETLDMASAAPLQKDKDGKYPIPQPGIVTKREY